MSATIYALPTELENLVPDVFTVKNYDEAEKGFITTTANWCKKRNPTGDKKYIGETISFPVADGSAVYMVAALRPLQLIHLPLMDGYQAGDVDLMTAKRVKEKIDNEKKLQAFFLAQSQATIAECKDAIEKVGIDTTNMPQEEFDSLYNPNEYKYIPIAFEGVKYLVPVFDLNHDYKHRVYKYLCNNFRDKDLVESN